MSGKVGAEQRVLVLEHQVAGTQYCVTPDVIKSIPEGAPLFLDRELDNDVDENAICVYWTGVKLGYVPATYAKVFAPMMDNGFQLEASVTECVHQRFIVLMEVFLIKPRNSTSS